MQTTPGSRALVAATLLTALALALSRLVSATGDASFIWPPLGIAFGLVLAWGCTGLLPVLAGLLLWVLLTGQPWLLLPVAALEIVAGTLVAVGSYRLFRAHARSALLQAGLFFGSGVFAGGLASALVGSAGFHAVGLYRDLGYGELLLAFWVTEAMGVLVFAGLARALARDGLSALRQDAALAWRWVGVLLLVFGLLWLVHAGSGGIALPLAGLLVVWPAMRAQPAFLNLAVLVVAAAMIAVELGAAGHALTNRDVLGLVLRIAGFAVLAQLLNVVALERAAILQREREQARRDLLTGLGNERALRERLARGADTTLVLLRLEDMGSVADLLGAGAVEELERTLAAELRAAHGDAVQRLERGRYAICLPVADAAAAETLARQLHERLDGRVFHGESDLVALRPTLAVVQADGRGAEEMLLAGELALAVAATHTGERIEIAADTRDLVLARRDLVRRQEEVKAALAEHRFVLYAQPIVPLAGSGEGIHCEILLRLRQPDGSIAAPGYFMPAAERAQLTGAIDRYVIERLLTWLAGNPQATARLGKCAINLTGWSVSDPALAPWIRAQVAAHGIPPQKLCFEITESQAIASREHAHRLIVSLRELGASVSLDDFGTGLATFDYLKSFPFDYLKIDGGFIKTIDNSPVDQAIVQAMVTVARTMGLRTIAEFVEHEGITGYLRTAGVDYAQGYGLGRPQPLAELLLPGDGGGDVPARRS